MKLSQIISILTNIQSNIGDVELVITRSDKKSHRYSISYLSALDNNGHIFNYEDDVVAAIVIHRDERQNDVKY